jgi:hypothetical protein
MATQDPGMGYRESQLSIFGLIDESIDAYPSPRYV